MSRQFALIAFAASLLAVAATLLLMPWHEGPVVGGEALAAASVPPPARPHEPLAPLPQDRGPIDPERAALGERLFHERALSADGSVSCSSCHPLHRGGMDGKPRSTGVGGASGLVNTPTVFNARYNFAQFWDGRAATLEDQVSGPLHSKVEMASTWALAIARLSEREDYREGFADIYPEGINAATIADAIANFERTLVTPDSRFDRYLRGETGALNALELEGYARFKALGCASCHQGMNVGGNLFQRFGVVGDYFAERGDVTVADLGRFNLTGREADRHVFRVPSLRNVALTAPYFHDGSIASLDEAVAIMGRFQLGRTLSKEDRELIVAFLHTLTGELQGDADR